MLAFSLPLLSASLVTHATFGRLEAMSIYPRLLPDVMDEHGRASVQAVNHRLTVHKVFDGHTPFMILSTNGATLNAFFCTCPSDAVHRVDAAVLHEANQHHTIAQLQKWHANAFPNTELQI